MCCVIPPNSPATTSVSRIGVQELGLPVVDVAHDGHDRRTRHEPASFDLLLGLGVELFLDPDDLGLMAQVGRDQLDGVVGERRGRGHHLPGHEQDLHDVGRRLPELLRDRLRRRPANELHHRQRGFGRRPRRRGRGGRRRHRGGTGSRRPSPRRGAVGRRGRDRLRRRHRARPSRPASAAAAFLGLRGAGGGSSTSRRLGVEAVALPPLARSRGIRSSGTLDEADRPAAPICSSAATSSLLVTPSSFASS